MENKNSPAVSIIIPVYNREKYIAECLDSIFAQTFKNFEVVLVDDCSTDKSREIVENYLADFSDKLRIINLEQNSGGPSKPRNIGIKFARGEYIFFVDSDDVIIPTALEELYPLAKKNNVDVLHCDRIYRFSGETAKNAKMKIRGAERKAALLEGKIPLEKFVTGRFSAATWRWLIRREFLLKNKIEFSNINIGEDKRFFVLLLFFSQRFLYTPTPVYCYRNNPSSVSKYVNENLETFRKRAFLSIDTAEYLEEFMSRFDYFKEHPEIKFGILERLVVNPLETWSNKFFEEGLPMKIREEIVRQVFKETMKDPTEFAVFLFNKVVNYRATDLQFKKQLAEQAPNQEENKNLQEEIKKLREENKKLKNQIQGTFKLLQEEVKNLQSL